MSQRGAILVEFAIVIPTLVLIGFCCIEFSRVLGVDQFASTMSRQLAQTALRQCLGRIAFSADVTSSTDCLLNGDGISPNRVRELFEFSDSSPGSELILSVYEHRINSGGIPYFTRVSKIQSTRVGNTFRILEVAEAGSQEVRYRSRFSLDTASSTNYAPNRPAYQLSSSLPLDQAALSKHKYIFIAEAYIRYDLIVGLVRGLLGRQDARYDAAVF